MSIRVVNDAERSRASNAQRAKPMRAGAFRKEMLIAGAYLVAALALPAAVGVDGSFSPTTAALYVIGIAVASQVRFEIGAGFTVPIQVLFVPFLFAVPPSLGPLLIPVALLLGMTQRVLRREISPSWLLTAVGNSYFAIGPAVVLAVAGDHDPRGRLAILLLALVAQFACDFAASAVRARLHDDLPVRELVQELRPIYAIDAALAFVGLLVALAVIPADGQYPVLFVVPLLVVLKVFSEEREERLKQLAELNDAYQGTALLLGDVVEADDAYTGEHCRGVVRLASEVAQQLGLDAERKRNIELAALLHDIGKIAVPKEIINKPGKLDEGEWAIVKAHTIEGQHMLEKIGGLMREIGRIVRASHERWDGRGYPDGLSGDAIPIEARIVCACDAFNAMTTTRPYRSARSPSEAVADLERCAGTQFDPRVVDAVLSVVAQDHEETEQRRVAAFAAAPAGEERHPLGELSAGTLGLAP